MGKELAARFDTAACQPTDAPLIVGLSGGRDSVALLLLLLQAGCTQLEAVHIHHGIRGAEADADELFCAELCARLGVCYHSVRIDVPKLARQNGESLETAARHARRNALKHFAQKHPAPRIALAHHADDQAETVLFRLARGAAGCRGMQPITVAEQTTWLRPMLGISRAAITQWLKEQGQTWRDDSTNAVADVARNRIRHEVLPALNRALGRDVTPILCRSAQLQAETQEALNAAIEKLPILDPQGRLYLPFVLGQPASLRKAILHYYLQMHKIPGISTECIDALDGMLPADAPYARYNLPGGYTAARSHKRLLILAPAATGN